MYRFRLTGVTVFTLKYHSNLVNQPKSSRVHTVQVEEFPTYIHENHVYYAEHDYIFHVFKEDHLRVVRLDNNTCIFGKNK